MSPRSEAPGVARELAFATRVARAHPDSLRLEEILATQANVLDDIELGLCSVQCAGAIRSEGACHCSCKGDNHGKLWAAQ